MEKVKQGDSTAQSGEVTALINSRYSISEIRSTKGEDRFLAGAHPGSCDFADAVFGVFDGHGGKEAAIYCQNNFLRYVNEEYKAVKERQGGHAATLDMQQPGEEWEFEWPVGADEAIGRAFVRIDKDIQAEMRDGTTAVVVFLRRDVDGQILVKCAWAGDSRAILCFPGSQGLVELSSDHKPSDEAEAARIAAQAGGRFAIARRSISRAMKRVSLELAGEGAASPRRPSTPLVDSEGQKEAAARGAEGRPWGDVYSRIRSQSYPALRRSNGGGDSVDVVTSRPKEDELMPPGGSPISVLEAGSLDIGGIKEVWTPRGDAVGEEEDEEAEPGTSAPGIGSIRPGLRTRSAHDSAHARGLAPSSPRSHQISVTSQSRAPSPATAPAASLEVSDLTEEETAAGEEREPAARVSYVGRLRDRNGNARGAPRVFNPRSGISLAVSRSIGDRDGARSVIAEPDIRNAVIPPGVTARIIIASDGVWDVVNNAKAYKFGSAPDLDQAAADLVRKSYSARFMAGMYMDDVTGVLVDINTRPKDWGSSGSAPADGVTGCGCFGGGSRPRRSKKIKWENNMYAVSATGA